MTVCANSFSINHSLPMWQRESGTVLHLPATVYGLCLEKFLYLQYLLQLLSWWVLLATSWEDEEEVWSSPLARGSSEPGTIAVRPTLLQIKAFVCFCPRAILPCGSKDIVYNVFLPLREVQGRLKGQGRQPQEWARELVWEPFLLLVLRETSKEDWLSFRRKPLFMTTQYLKRFLGSGGESLGGLDDST